MLDLDNIVKFLNQFFAIERFIDDQGGIYRPSQRPIQRFGLALEPWSELTAWANTHRLDALFLHRPWKLAPSQLPPDVGVVAYHLAFDERMTLGFNPRLAEVLGMSSLEILGEKAGRPIGMLGKISASSFEQYSGYVNQVFGGHDAVYPCGNEIKSVAVVGAMTDALVREAAERGANIYITGQFRQPAKLAVAQTQIGVIVVGHRRSELWGLRALTGVVRERWSDLDVVYAQR